MKRFVIIIVTIILLLFIIWSGIYFFIAKTLTKEVAKLSENQNHYQTTLKCENLNISGYPFTFNVRCQDVTFSDGDMNFSLAGFVGEYSIFRSEEHTSELQSH